MKQPILSQWGSGSEILYKCPCCEASFRIYADKEL